MLTLAMSTSRLGLTHQARGQSHRLIAAALELPLDKKTRGMLAVRVSISDKC
ncbi:hypothetical protein [Devosia alba]|uniref:hypothetical protein n=1 Tax=Devosia alba TaxID=3152360 RepID=UPI003266CE6D